MNPWPLPKAGGASARRLRSEAPRTERAWMRLDALRAPGGSAPKLKLSLKFRSLVSASGIDAGWPRQAVRAGSVHESPARLAGGRHP